MSFGLKLNLKLGLRSLVGVVDNAWTPADLPNLYMWFDASDASTITLSGSDVTQINDKSGNNYHATQSTVSLAPEWGTATINSLNVLDFNKTNNYMVTGGVAALDRSMAIVAVYPSGSGTRIPVGVRDSANERSYIGQNSTKSRFAAAEIGNTDGASLPSGTKNVQVGYHNTAKDMRHYLNGTQDISTIFTGTIGSVHNYYLGGLNDAGSVNQFAVFNGQLAEVVFTSDVISDSNREKLEGYLAHKWGTEAKLPASHPYKSAPPTKSQTWTPSNLPNLALWLDASDASTITLNGSKVSQWDDKSGNNRNASQATASNQPTYTTAGLNGNPVVRLSTSTQSLVTNASFGSSSQRSVFSLNTYTAVSQYQYVWHQESASTSGSALVFRAQSAFSDWQQNDTISWADGYSSGRTPRFISNGVTGDGSAAIHEVSLGNQESQLRINGASANARVQLTGAWPNIARTFSVGRGSQSLNGDVAEIIYVDGVVSTSDRQKLEGYLAWKWGLEADLPSGHPYKSTPPTV